QLVARAELDGDMLYMHCRAGCGRTGAMAACLLVRREGLRAGDAVDRIRALRDCSVESDEQEDGVAAWQEYLGGQR
ncbi:MAG: dual specificity protein phosphatase family protein, partial [Myxococcales bacterium]|nr:dual specificity protein phosphatase family protein [Myxococcales bacterium]